MVFSRLLDVRVLYADPLEAAGCEAMSGERYNNYSLAQMTVDREMLALRDTIDEKKRQDFFAPENRDEWMDAFIERLKTRYQQPDRIASND